MYVCNENEYVMAAWILLGINVAASDGCNDEALSFWILLGINVVAHNFIQRYICNEHTRFHVLSFP